MDSRDLGQVLTPEGNLSQPKFNPALFRAMAESSGLFSPTLKLGTTSTMNGLGTGKPRSIASMAAMSSQTNPRSLISLPPRHLMTTSQVPPASSVQSIRHGFVRPDDMARSMVAA